MNQTATLAAPQPRVLADFLVNTRVRDAALVLTAALLTAACLTLPASGWSPQEIERFTTQLRAAAVDVRSEPGKLTLSHRQPSARSK